MESENIRQRVCRICSENSDGAHFGIDACRACAAFFRRSVVLSKKYVCRQGGNNCRINKSVRCMCRKCRLRKCIEAGMMVESVQIKQDPIEYGIVEAEASRVRVVSYSSDSDLQGSPNSNWELAYPCPLIAHSSSKIPYHLQTHEVPHLLHKIINNYNQMCSVRRTTELAAFSTSHKDLFDKSDPLSGMSRMTCTKWARVGRATLPTYSEFVSSTFEEFQEYNQAEKWLVFPTFVAMFMHIDGMYRTYQKLPTEELHKKVLCTMTSYWDLEDPEYFLSDVPMPKFNIINVIRHLEKSCIKPHRQMMSQISKFDVREEEFAVLVALCAFCPSIENSTPKIVEVSGRMRCKIFDQLHIWYRLNGTENYAARIGELMCIYGTMMQNSCRVKEDLEIYKLMDVFSEESFFYDLLA